MKKIAFYLPQFHPIPENDIWWGKGFTEWTNVTKAKALFKNHIQPFLPGELGFYDLRLDEAKMQQIELARTYGISGFCYWHYWFGNGKVILEQPIWQVYRNKELDYPFCLAWANETWTGHWHGLGKEVLIEQKYLGEEDYKEFFYYNLPLFKDNRYLKKDGKLLFCIYKPHATDEIKTFIKVFRDLAKEENIGDFYFIGINSGNEILSKGFDAFMSGMPNVSEEMIRESKHFKGFYKKAKRFLGSKTKDYPQVIEYTEFVDQQFNVPIQLNECPVLLPNWDNTPRAQQKGLVLNNSNPEQWRRLIEKMIKMNQSNGIIFIKSWNEWAEGNVLEPSLRFGRAYLEVFKECFGD